MPDPGTAVSIGSEGVQICVGQPVIMHWQHVRGGTVVVEQAVKGPAGFKQAGEERAGSATGQQLQEDAQGSMLALSAPNDCPCTPLIEQGMLADITSQGCMLSNPHCVQTRHPTAQAKGSHRCFPPCLPLQVAAHIPLSSLPVLAHLLAHAPITVNEGHLTINVTSAMPC